MLHGKVPLACDDGIELADAHWHVVVVHARRGWQEREQLEREYVRVVDGDSALRAAIQILAQPLDDLR